MSLWILRMIEEQFHRDDEDRPLRESRTPPQYLRPGEIEHRPCPYGGSRAGHPLPMNVSALRQASVHWSDLLDALSFVRVIYAERRGPHVPELIDLWRISQLGASLPWFFLLRTGERPPAYAASLAKTSLGLGLWAQRQLVDLLSGAWPPEPLTPQVILQLTERNGTLIGATEVCSGSEKMLLRFFEALVGGTPELTSPQLVRLASERTAVELFGAHFANFKLMLWIHYLARRFVYADLVAALPGRAPLEALLAGGCEPPDFYTVGPADLAPVPLPLRAAWLGSLALLVRPMAPDHSDEALQLAALQLAVATGEPAAPPALAQDLVKEVKEVTGCSAASAALAGRTLATFVRLDALLGDLATTVERGLRSSSPSATASPEIDAASRDRLLGMPPRAALTALAPTTLGSLLPR